MQNILIPLQTAHSFHINITTSTFIQINKSSKHKKMLNNRPKEITISIIIMLKSRENTEIQHCIVLYCSFRYEKYGITKTRQLPLHFNRHVKDYEALLSLIYGFITSVQEAIETSIM